jgi:hypothetical protein
MADPNRVLPALRFRPLKHLAQIYDACGLSETGAFWQMKPYKSGAAIAKP